MQEVIGEKRRRRDVAVGSRSGDHGLAACLGFGFNRLVAGVPELDRGLGTATFVVRPGLEHHVLLFALDQDPGRVDVHRQPSFEGGIDELHPNRAGAGCDKGAVADDALEGPRRGDVGANRRAPARADAGAAAYGPLVEVAGGFNAGRAGDHPLDGPAGDSDRRAVPRSVVDCDIRDFRREGNIKSPVAGFVVHDDDDRPRFSRFAPNGHTLWQHDASDFPEFTFIFHAVGPRRKFDHVPRLIVVPSAFPSAAVNTEQERAGLAQGSTPVPPGAA